MVQTVLFILVIVSALYLIYLQNYLKLLRKILDIQHKIIDIYDQMLKLEEIKLDPRTRIILLDIVDEFKPIKKIK